MRLILVLMGLLGAYIWFNRNKGVKNTPQGRLKSSESFGALPPAKWKAGDDPWQ